MNQDESPKDVARRVVNANSYLTLATVDPSGHPWATPVWFAAVECDQFIWASKPGARHSVNISNTPEVGIVIFDSSIPPGGSDAGYVEAVYVEAVAEEVPAGELEAAIGVYSKRAEARDLGVWRAADVTEPAAHRLFRASASRVYILSSTDSRILVE